MAGGWSAKPDPDQSTARVDRFAASSCGRRAFAARV